MTINILIFLVGGMVGFIVGFIAARCWRRASVADDIDEWQGRGRERCQPSNIGVERHGRIVV